MDAGVSNGTPSGKTILPPFSAETRRNPESSTSKRAFGSHQPPTPCIGVAKEQNGERGVRYSFLKIRSILSLKNGVSGTISNFSYAPIFVFQSYMKGVSFVGPRAVSIMSSSCKSPLAQVTRTSHSFSGASSSSTCGGPYAPLVSFQGLA